MSTQDSGGQYGGGQYGGGVNRPLGSILNRFFALIIDSLLITVPASILGAILAQFLPIGVVVLLIWVMAIGIFVWNYVFKLGNTGQTVGKGLMGLTVLGTYTGQPIGAGKAFLRYFLGNIINSLLALDYWVGIFRANHQRLSDQILDANVYEA